VGRHGTSRLAKVGLISAVAPLMVKTAANPGGLPMKVFDGLRAASTADRSQLYRTLAAGPFFGANRKGTKVSQGVMDTFWLHGMQSGHKNAFDCIKAFSETDFTPDLKKFDVPTLIVHGDADQVVPIGASGLAAAAIVKGAVLKVYAGAPHGLTATHANELNADLLAFIATKPAEQSNRTGRQKGAPTKPQQAVAKPAIARESWKAQQRDADAAAKSRHASSVDERAL